MTDIALLKLLALGTTSITMILGVWLVFARLKALQQGFGPNSFKSLGIVLFLPTLIILALTIPGLQTQTLTALLGTVAGFVLSKSEADRSAEK